MFDFHDRPFLHMFEYCVYSTTTTNNFQIWFWLSYQQLGNRLSAFMKILLTLQQWNNECDLNSVCFAAEHYEMSSLRCNRVHLDRRSSVCDNDGVVINHGHHSGNVCTMGRLQYLRNAEGDGNNACVFHVHSAVVGDSFLLLQNCLRTTGTKS